MKTPPLETAERFALWCSCDDAFIVRYARPVTVCAMMEATLRLRPGSTFRIHTEDGAPPPTPAVVPAFLKGPERAELRASLAAGSDAA